MRAWTVNLAPSTVVRKWHQNVITLHVNLPTRAPRKCWGGWCGLCHTSRAEWTETSCCTHEFSAVVGQQPLALTVVEGKKYFAYWLKYSLRFEENPLLGGNPCCQQDPPWSKAPKPSSASRAGAVWPSESLGFASSPLWIN